MSQQRAEAAKYRAGLSAAGKSASGGCLVLPARIVIGVRG
jgi:hypothetical protein